MLVCVTEHTLAFPCETVTTGERLPSISTFVEERIVFQRNVAFVAKSDCLARAILIHKRITGRQWNQALLTPVIQQLIVRIEVISMRLSAGPRSGP
jgi:hypothetical protein